MKIKSLYRAHIMPQDLSRSFFDEFNEFVQKASLLFE